MTYPGTSFGDPGTAQRTATVTLNADVSGYANQMGAAAQQTNALSGSVDKLQSKLGSLHSWGGHKLLSFGLRDFAALGVATADAATFEKQLSTLSATSAITGTSMHGIKSGIESAFTKFPVARGEVIALTGALTNMGVTGEGQIGSLTRTFLKLGAATGENTVGLAQGLTQLSRLMGNTDATQIGNMANSLLTVSKTAGVSASGVLDFAQAIAPMARQAGIGQGAVLGISTAFTKAGADGYVAANTFNSIIQDISQMAKTGSPEIAKYANLIGVTAEQFKKMPGQQQITQVLSAVGKGGPAATAFVQEQGYGVRAQSAIAAVTQSGDLQRQIDIATGAQGNQKNLNKGAAAAWNDLADKLAHVRNEFTQLGTAIGTTFLKPLEAGVTGIGMFASGLNSLLKPFSALIAIAGVGAGALGVVGGAAMNVAGIIGGIALTRMVTRGMHVRAAGAGYRAERAGGDLEKLSAKDRLFMERYTAGTLSRGQEYAYSTGTGAGRFVGPRTDRLAGLNRMQRIHHDDFTDRTMGRADRRLYYQGMRYGHQVQDPTIATPKEQQRLADETAGLSRNQLGVYNAGSAYSRLPRGGELGKLSNVRNLAIAAPFRAVQWFNNTNAQMLRESTRADFDRLRFRDEQPRLKFRERFDRMVNETANKPALDVVGQETLRTGRSVGNVINANVNAGASQFGPLVGRMIRYSAPRILTSVVAGASGIPLAGTMTNKVRSGIPHDDMASATEGLSRSWLRVGAAMRHPIKGFEELGRAAGSSAKALAELGAKATLAGGATFGNFAGRKIGEGASALWGGLKAVGSKAMTLPGMLAISAGTMAYSKLSSAYNESQHQGDIQNFLNPIQKYNDALGTTTTNLANFSNALKEGTTTASGSAAITMAQAATVTGGDEGNKPHKATTKVFNALKGHLVSGDKTEALVDTLASMPITDAKQLQAAKEDMLASGWSEGRVKKALSLYMQRGGPNQLSGIGKSDFSYMGQAAANSEGNGLSWTGDAGASKSGGQILGSMLSGLDSQRQTDSQQVGGVYAQQKELKGLMSGLAPMVDRAKNGENGNMKVAGSKALADALSKVAGGGKGDYEDYILNHDAGKGVEGQRAFVVKALGATKQGRAYLKTITDNKGTLDYDKIDSKLGVMEKHADANSFRGLLQRDGGALGKFAAKDATVQAAGGTLQGSPGYQDAAAQKLLDQAVKVGGGFTGAAAALEKFKGAVGDSSSALYKQIQAAQMMAQQEAAYRTPFQTRGQNFNQTVTAYQQASAAYNDLPTDKRGARSDYLKPTKDAYEQALGEQQQYLQQMYQTAQSYGVQMVRAAKDEGVQVSRAKRNFGTQMLQAQLDYQRQSRRSTDDFNLQTDRANADHVTQLKNQAATAAQSIYDPFARIQSKYVIDAGTLSQNLGDQNAALAKQQAELRKAKKMGLSEQSIQELNLADPNNAQQLNELTEYSLTPAVARKINAQEQKRAGLTTKLTQNPDNLAFQQSERDFHKQMDRSSEDFHRTMRRAETDYDTSVSRAEKQQAISMSDMADDYNRTVKRAGEDLTMAMTEVTGNFGSMYDKTMAQIARSVEKFSPKAANQMRKDLKGLVAEFPFLQYGDAASYNGSGAVTTPDTVGVNAKGQVGYYDAAGKFYTVKAAGMNKATLPQIAPPAAPGQPVQRGARGDGGVVPAGTIPLPQGQPHPRVQHQHQTYAEGGISVGPQLAWVSEWAQNAAEAHIPLNDRGATFMSDVISKALIQKMHTHGHGMMPSGSSSHYEIHEDHSTRFSGDMHIAAADLSDLIRQLVAKQRLSKLSSPSRR